VTVSDPFISNLTRIADTTGDNDNLLEVGETWAYTASHTVTQAEIDSGNNIVNVATADSNETGPDTDDASIPVAQNPSLNITKDASVPGNTADVAGEVISYTIGVQNTGNQTLTGCHGQRPVHQQPHPYCRHHRRQRQPAGSWRDLGVHR
jgi:hypothetical protein